LGSLAYDEAAKQNTRAVLVQVLDQSMRLLHPMMPCVTEEIWQHLPHEGEALIVAEWNHGGEATDPEAEAQFERIMSAVRAIRNARSEFNVESSKRIAAIIAAGEYVASFESQQSVLSSLARLDPAQFVNTATVTGTPPSGTPVSGTSSVVANKQSVSPVHVKRCPAGKHKKVKRVHGKKVVACVAKKIVSKPPKRISGFTG